MSTLTRAQLNRLDALAARAEQFASAVPGLPEVTRAAGLLRREYDKRVPEVRVTRDITPAESEMCRALWDEVHRTRYHAEESRAEPRRKALAYFRSLHDAGVSQADLARALPVSRQRMGELLAEE